MSSPYPPQLPMSARPSLRPAPQALHPRPRFHRIDVGIREHDATPAPHASLPLEANSGQRHAARIGITAVGQGKGQNVVCHRRPPGPGS
jgi:hypothetical protein